ncbi:hypothetical protein R0K05_17135 [Planococcus sp. SIMBA_160]
MVNVDDMLASLLELDDACLTGWEMDFVSDVYRQREAGERDLTGRQIEKLTEVYERHCGD